MEKIRLLIHEEVECFKKGAIGERTDSHSWVEQILIPIPYLPQPKRTLWITTILFVNESQRSPAFELLMVGIRDVVRHEYMFEDGIEFGFSSKSKETELGDKAD